RNRLRPVRVTSSPEIPHLEISLSGTCHVRFISLSRNHHRSFSMYRSGYLMVDRYQYSPFTTEISLLPPSLIFTPSKTYGSYLSSVSFETPLVTCCPCPLL